MVPSILPCIQLYSRATSRYSISVRCWVNNSIDQIMMAFFSPLTSFQVFLDHGWIHSKEARLYVSFRTQRRLTYNVFCKLAGHLCGYLHFKVLKTITLHCRVCKWKQNKRKSCRNWTRWFSDVVLTSLLLANAYVNAHVTAKGSASLLLLLKQWAVVQAQV